MATQIWNERLDNGQTIIQELERLEELARTNQASRDFVVADQTYLAEEADFYAESELAAHSQISNRLELNNHRLSEVITDRRTGLQNRLEAKVLEHLNTLPYAQRNLIQPITVRALQNAFVNLEAEALEKFISEMLTTIEELARRYESIARARQEARQLTSALRKLARPTRRTEKAV